MKEKSENEPNKSDDSNANAVDVPRLVIRPVGCPPEIWRALQYIYEAQLHLDTYEGSNRIGKEYHRTSAVEYLKGAHNALWVWISAIDCTCANQSGPIGGACPTCQRQDMAMATPTYSQTVMSELVEAFERYGGGASMMHPRLMRAITAARKHLSEEDSETTE